MESIGRHPLRPRRTVGAQHCFEPSARQRLRRKANHPAFGALLRSHPGLTNQTRRRIRCQPPAPR